MSRPGRSRLLADLLDAVHDRLARWQDAAGDADIAGLASEYRMRSATIGMVVAVDQSNGRLTGRATGIDESGRLLISLEGDGAPIAVAAGDVTQLRPVSR